MVREVGGSADSVLAGVMRGATFLFVINGFIGLSFAAAFLGLSSRSRIELGRWCAAGFLSAAATVMVEALAPFIPSPRLVSGLSFSLLLLALTLITAGLTRHYRNGMSVTPAFLLWAATALFNAAVTYDLPRGTLAQAIAYQGPFAAMAGLGAARVLGARRGRTGDRLLGCVLVLIALQFLAKAGVPLVGEGMAPQVRGYVVSLYAYYSQTIGAVLSLLLGLALLGVIVAELVAETTRRLERDPLSGALTRAAFIDRASRFVKDLPPGRRACLVMADLDHFKSVNDRFGHAAGDEVIGAFGALLRDIAGPDDLCGRVGGEEFCLLLPDLDIAEMPVRLDAVRAALAGRAFRLVPPGVRVTASFGVAMIGAGEALDSVIRRADRALYAAKAAGRDGHVLAELSAEPPCPRASPGWLGR